VGVLHGDIEPRLGHDGREERHFRIVETLTHCCFSKQGTCSAAPRCRCGNCNPPSGGIKALQRIFGKNLFLQIRAKFC
jgi:hypothetical protein